MTLYVIDRNFDLDLKKIWRLNSEKSGLSSSLPFLSELSFTNDEINEELQLPSVEELREKIQNCSITSSNGEIYCILCLFQNCFTLFCLFVNKHFI